MITRRKFIAAALAAPLVPLGSAMAQDVKEESAKQADFLFVQTAKGMNFDKSTNKLTLEGSARPRCFSLTAPSALPEI